MVSGKKFALAFLLIFFILIPTFIEDSKSATNATITGRVTFNNRPISELTNKVVSFWARDENNATYSYPINPTYDPSTGVYSIPNMPPSTYGIGVFVDYSEPFNGEDGFPGDLDGFSDVTVPNGAATVSQDLPVQITIHLTSPSDNSAKIGNTYDPKPIYSSDVIFDWDDLKLPPTFPWSGCTYSVSIDEYSEPYAFQRNILSVTVNHPWQPFLSPSTGSNYYLFQLYAYASDTGLLVGKLMTVYANGYGWDYRFRIGQGVVTPTPTPTPATPTPTPTPTPTLTPTPTPTPKPTPTPTPTPTPKPIVTPTPTPTPVSISTAWNVAQNNYQEYLSAANSAWAPNGNCYGFSSTAILYFMHYTLGYTSNPTYPFYPSQTPQATCTNNLTLPPLNACDKNGNSITTELNNASLAIMFHQLFEYPNLGINWQTQISNEKQQIDNLVANLRSGKPSILVLGNSTNGYHATVAYALSMVNGGQTYQIELYDPNFPKAIPSAVYADYTPATNSFTYSFASYYKGIIDNIDHFGINMPNLISSSWHGDWIWWPWSDWTYYQPTGYTIIIANAPLIVSSNGLTDFFSDSSSRSDSTKFVCGIPGSSGIEEAGIQVYAIPSYLPYKVIDPTNDESTIMIESVNNETGQLVGQGFLVNLEAPQGIFNYTIEPSNIGLLLSTSSALNANITFFSATEQDHAVFQASSIPIAESQTANFTITDWQSLNSTHPVSLIISSINQLTEITTYSPTNELQSSSQSGQSALSTLSTEQISLLVTTISIALVTCVAIIFIYTRRRKHKSQKT